MPSGSLINVLRTGDFFFSTLYSLPVGISGPTMPNGNEPLINSPANLNQGGPPPAAGGNGGGDDGYGQGLDWSIVSKKGVTRYDHVNKHGVDDPGKEFHG